MKNKNLWILIAIIAVVIVICAVYAFSSTSLLGAPANCRDTDGGRYPDIAGIVYYKTNTLPDKCLAADTVREFYCKNNNTSYAYESIKCSSGRRCKNGACALNTTLIPGQVLNASGGTFCSINSQCGNSTTTRSCNGNMACINSVTYTCIDSICMSSHSPNCMPCSLGTNCSNGFCVPATQCSDICASVFKVQMIVNQTTGYSHDRVILRNIKSGELYDAVMTSDGVGTITIYGKVYNIRYFGASNVPPDDLYISLSPWDLAWEQKVYRSSYVIPSMNRTASFCDETSYQDNSCVKLFKVQMIANSTAGYSNDRVSLVDVKSGDVYNALITSEGVGTITLGGIVYGLRYFGASTSPDNDRYISLINPLSETTWSEQRVYKDAYIVI